MRKIKVVFFNPIMLSKRTYTFIVTRDDYNHLWNIEISCQFWHESSVVRVRYDYSKFVDTFVSNISKDGEYTSIKEVIL